MKEPKLFFTPGPVYSKQNITINFSHRSKNYSDLYKKVERKLINKFGLFSKYWDVIFIQGSSTAAIESVLTSLKPNKTIEVYSNGIFGDRAKEIAQQHFKKVYYNLPFNPRDNITRVKTPEDVVFVVDYETSKSVYNNARELFNIYPSKTIKIADCVSSLGYYPIPMNADIIITSSSKIIGGLPTMGIIFIRKDVKRYIISKGYYLNLQRYIKFKENYQTPNTSLIPQLISLDKALDNMITKKQIDNNIRTINNIPNSTYVGDKNSPVITIKATRKMERELKKGGIELYFNSNYMQGIYQISCFSYKDNKKYKQLKKVLENC